MAVADGNGHNEPDLAYNTVQTMLRIMEKKGLVEYRVDGRAFIYTARYSRDDSASTQLFALECGAEARTNRKTFRSYPPIPMHCSVLSFLEVSKMERPSW